MVRAMSIDTASGRRTIVTYPNRELRSSRVTKTIVVVLLAASVLLILAVAIGGWSELGGMQALTIVWCLAYAVIAFYVARWNRGLLPLVAALGCLMLLVSVLAGTGATGTSWFDRSGPGYAPAQSLFGGTGLSADALGVITLLIAPVQLALIVFAARAFTQAWNVELEVSSAQHAA